MLLTLSVSNQFLLHLIENVSVLYEGAIRRHFNNFSNLVSLGFVPPKILLLKERLKSKGLDTHEELDLDKIALMIKEAKQ